MTDRPADVVSLLWDNEDGTLTVEVVDYRTSPPEKVTRVFTDDAEVTDACERLDRASVVVPQEVTL